MAVRNRDVLPGFWGCLSLNFSMIYIHIPYLPFLRPSPFFFKKKLKINKERETRASKRREWERGGGYGLFVKIGWMN